MGNSAAKEETERAEEISEYLDTHPRFLVEYIDRNPHLLDGYVYEKVDEATVKEWLERVKTLPPSDILQLAKVDYNKESNAIVHHTDKYSHKNLVVRRADRFAIDIYFKNREFLPAKDSISLELSIGNDPKFANGTKIKLPMDTLVKASKWGCMLLNQDDTANKISVDVNIPADAIIGRYKVAVEITSELEGGMKTERTAKPDIIVIFNPFNPADDCFMENPSHRDEYVLNDVGLLYRGGWYDFSGKEWAFGQFDEGILDIALKLLRVDSRAKSNPERSLLKRSSPVFCSRVLSAMVNNFDAEGVVFGDWTGNYEGGKRPTFWSGSAKILQQWNETNMPVKYGQCWVFAGVLTTVMRAIGIPTRPVTNFRSAHDMEYNMTIDEFYEEDGSESEMMRSGDSIWNFHVWNEGYFRRPDLPKGYNGWQAVDGTPQEISNKLMQCGPAPVTAIKNGEIYIGYDSNFIFAEVNADVLEWQVDKEGQVTALLRRNERDVGRKLSTKAVGSNEREDLTDRYKYKEGTSEERKAFERAYAHGRKADYHDKFDVIKDEGAITIDHETIGEVVNGKTFTVAAKVTNTTSEIRDVIITTVIHTVLNTGARRGLVARERTEMKLDAGEVSQKTFSLDFNQYSSQLVDENAIRATTTVQVQQTNNLYVDTFDFHVKSPNCLEIKCADELVYDKYNNVQLVITNPLPVALTTGEFSIEGSGFFGASVKAVGPIAPGETYTSEVMEILPYRSTKIQLLADFDAREIMNIKASKSVQVA